MKTINWKTNSDREATVSISINKHIKHSNDGWGNIKEYDSPASTWTVNYSAKVTGHGEVNGCNTPVSTENLPAGFAGRLGKLCFDAIIAKKIEALIAEVKGSADWEKHLAAEKASDEADRKYYESDAEIKKAMGE